MLIDATQEGSGGVFPDFRLKYSATPGVLVHKRGKIVNETSDENERAGLRLFLD